MASSLRTRIPWQDKMNQPAGPRIVQVPKKWQRQYGTGTMLIATPKLVDALMRKPPRGRLITIRAMRERLAKDYKADSTCPLTTGIFVRVVSEASNEHLESGKKRVTPFWRVVRDDGSLLEKFPGGVQAQAKFLRKEGHSIVPARGKKVPRVKDLERSLIRL